MTGEQSFLRRLRERLPAIGDDAAVLAWDMQGSLVAAIDNTVEGVHFTLGSAEGGGATGADVGWRALAVNLSDLAAMGATPRVALAAVTVPPAPPGLADAVMEGLMECSDAFGCPLVGGDTTAGSLLAVTVAVLGHAERPVLRSGARPGDVVYVTGPLGGSIASGWRYLRVTPRLAEGRAAADGGATAMIDVSDGLATDLGHICEESGVGVRVDAAAVPVAEGATLALALTGGADYELCFTGPPGMGFVAIGEIVEGDERVVVHPDGTEEPLTGGWEHDIP